MAGKLSALLHYFDAGIDGPAVGVAEHHDFGCLADDAFTADTRRLTEVSPSDGAAARPTLGYFDGHTSDERPGTSEKSSGLKVTNVARWTRA